jgi:hypothetical protein
MYLYSLQIKGDSNKQKSLRFTYNFLSSRVRLSRLFLLRNNCVRNFWIIGQSARIYTDHKQGTKPRRHPCFQCDSNQRHQFEQTKIFHVLHRAAAVASCINVPWSNIHIFLVSRVEQCRNKFFHSASQNKIHPQQNVLCCRARLLWQSKGSRGHGHTLSEQWCTKSKLNSMVWVREPTIPTELPSLVGEVIVKFCG